ncbi:MAG: DUF111 family protein [Anaerococcus sp.]|nr:DUF111 family protein [Anaerococcus sp.]
MGFLMDKLMEVARDVYYTPIYMKKNRPAYKLSVLADSDKIDEVEDIIFANSTSIGIRKFPVERKILDRKTTKISYKGIDLHYKLVNHKDKTYVYGEYKSALDLAKLLNLPLKEAYKKLDEVYEEIYEKKN